MALGKTGNRGKGSVGFSRVPERERAIRGGVTLQKVGGGRLVRRSPWFWQEVQKRTVETS